MTAPKPPAEIHFINTEKISAVPLLHQVAQMEGLEAVLITYRSDGRWRTVWGGADLNHASLALAAMKTFRDVSDATEEETL